LENLLEAATALTSGDRVESEDLRLAMGAGAAAADLSSGTLDEVLRSHVLRTLDRCQGSRTTAARALGIDRTTLYRMLMRWNATQVAERNIPKRSTPRKGPNRRVRS
jgi:transcriptional regulator of acetoin/glycerol metabolism